MKNSQLMRKSVLYIVVFIWLSISILPVYASSDKIKEEPVKRIVRVGLHDFGISKCRCTLQSNI